MPVLLPAREPALSVVPGASSSFESGVAPASPETLVALGSATNAGLDVLANILVAAKPMSTSVAPSETQTPIVTDKGPAPRALEVPNSSRVTEAEEAEVDSRSLVLAVGPDAPTQRIVAEASAQTSSLANMSEGSRSSQAESVPVVEVRSILGLVGDGSPRESSEPTSVAPTETYRPRMDEPVAYPATSGALAMNDQVNELLRLETAESITLTRQLAAFSICLGVFIAWKGYQSSAASGKKARESETEAAFGQSRIPG
jgi:hypothetical protein